MDGPCTFPPFECRSISKTNSEKRKSNSRFSFWYFHSKTKSGSQLSAFRFYSKTNSRSHFFASRFGTSTPKRKAVVNLPLFVWKLLFRNEKRSQLSAFPFGVEVTKTKSKSQLLFWNFVTKSNFWCHAMHYIMIPCRDVITARGVSRVGVTRMSCDSRGHL